MDKKIMTSGDLSEAIIAGYRRIPVTPQNSKVVRAACYALLANVLASDLHNGWSDNDDDLLGEARKAIDKALILCSSLSVPDPVKSLTSYASGLVLRAELGHHNREARIAFQEATRYDPTFARAKAQEGTELIYLGEFESALILIDEAIKLGSDDASLGLMKFNRGRALLFLGRTEEAISSLEEALELRNNLWFIWMYLISAYALVRPIGVAERKLEEFRRSTIKEAAAYSLDIVKEHEKAIPNTSLSFQRAREEIFYEGLNKVLR